MNRINNWLKPARAKSTNSSGQILLIILLVLAVGLTVGLAVISRSVTDIRISQQQEESARTFSAAEAGIEKAIKTGVQETGTIGNATYKVAINPQGNDTYFDFGGSRFAEGEIQTVWLVGHNGDIPDPAIDEYTGLYIKIYWGNDGEPNNLPTTPALEATLIYKEGTDFKVKKGAYDPNSNRISDNKFVLAGSAGYTVPVGGKKYQFNAPNFDINSAWVPYALRLRLLYNSSQSQPLVVVSDGSDNFPAQGNCYVSTATYAGSGITRKVQQCQFYKVPPGIFDYVLFSESDLVK